MSRPNRFMNLLRRGVGAVEGLVMHPQSKLWYVIKSPAYRYRRSGDVLDMLIYALDASRSDLQFVQIGSNDASHNDPLRTFIESRNWRGVMVEPVEYVFRRLAARYGDSRRVKLENAAIAASNEPQDFYYLEESSDPLPAWYDQLGSFSLPTILEHSAQIPDIERRVRVRKVPCLTFQSLCDKHALTHVDLVHIDTEGFDFEVLKLMDFNRIQPTCVVYEHRHLSEADQQSARNLLRRSGYDVVTANASDTVAMARDVLREDVPLRRAWTIAERIAGPASQILTTA